jgi:hypothetical protein
VNPRQSPRPPALRALLAAAVGALVLSAPALAAPLTRADLPSFCREWGGEDTIALACDPGKRAAGIHLRLGAGAADPSEERGIAQLRGREPLQPGETLSLTWSHPSSRAVLAVKVASPQGPRDVVLDLRARPARVDVIAQAGGALQVTTPAGSATVPAAPAPAEASWEPRTAHAAATGLLAAVDRMQRSLTALKTLCAALDRDVFSNFELLFGDPQRYPCVSGLAFSVFGDENVPRPTSTVHRGASLAVHRGRALLRTTLTHRYDPSSLSDPERLVVTARMLLVRDAQGIWRLATIEPLLALYAVQHRRAATDAELARLYRDDVQEGRRMAAAAARLQAARDAATVDGAAPAPCAVAPSRDRTGDVVVQESDFFARDQAAHAGVDLVGLGVSGRCLALRSAGPLPASFEVQLRDGRGRDLAITVANGRVLVQDTADDDDFPQPVRGVAAHLDVDGLVLALPFALSGTVDAMLGIELDDVSYGDDARVKSA